MKRFLIMVLAFLTLTAAAYAHGGMDHVMGTVTSIDATSITVKTVEGKTQTVALNSDTRYLRGENAATLHEIKIGDHIVIHATKKGDQLTAAEVKAGVNKSTHSDMSSMKMAPQ